MKLIDADALPRFGKRGGLVNWCDIVKAPTIDAVPVRHGKWTADETLYTQGMVVCSCCNADYYRDDLYMVGYALRELPKYCPNCGARMDEEREEE